jgi:hypothetical protein
MEQMLAMIPKQGRAMASKGGSRGEHGRDRVHCGEMRRSMPHPLTRLCRQHQMGMGAGEGDVGRPVPVFSRSKFCQLKKQIRRNFANKKFAALDSRRRPTKCGCTGKGPRRRILPAP